MAGGWGGGLGVRVPDLGLLVISLKKNSPVEKGPSEYTERAEFMWLKASWVQPPWLGVVL